MSLWGEGSGRAAGKAESKHPSIALNKNNNSPTESTVRLHTTLNLRLYHHSWPFAPEICLRAGGGQSCYGNRLDAAGSHTLQTPYVPTFMKKLKFIKSSVWIWWNMHNFFFRGRKTFIRSLRLSTLLLLLSTLWEELGEMSEKNWIKIYFVSFYKTKGLKLDLKR